MSPDQMQTLQAHDVGFVVEDPALKALFAVLMLLFVVAWIVAFWVYTGAIRNARESGRSYWLISLTLFFSSRLYFAANLAMFVIGVIIAMIVVGMMISTGRF